MKPVAGVFGLCEHPQVIDMTMLGDPAPVARCSWCPAEWSHVGDRYLSRPVRQGRWPTGTGWTNGR